MKKTIILSLLLASFVSVTAAAAFAGDRSADKTYVKGTLVDVSKYSGKEHRLKQVSVRIDDMIYTGDTNSAATREFVVGEPIEVRLEGNSFYLKRPSGKEIRLRIFKRERAR